MGNVGRESNKVVTGEARGIEQCRSRVNKVKWGECKQREWAKIGAWKWKKSGKWGQVSEMIGSKGE